MDALQSRTLGPRPKFCLYKIILILISPLSRFMRDSFLQLIGFSISHFGGAGVSLHAIVTDGLLCMVVRRDMNDMAHQFMQRYAVAQLGSVPKVHVSSIHRDSVRSKAKCHPRSDMVWTTDGFPEFDKPAHQSDFFPRAACSETVVGSELATERKRLRSLCRWETQASETAQTRDPRNAKDCQMSRGKCAFVERGADARAERHLPYLTTVYRCRIHLLLE